MEKQLHMKAHDGPGMWWSTNSYKCVGQVPPCFWSYSVITLNCFPTISNYLHLGYFSSHCLSFMTQWLRACKKKLFLLGPQRGQKKRVPKDCEGKKIATAMVNIITIVWMVMAEKLHLWALQAQVNHHPSPQAMVMMFTMADVYSIRFCMHFSLGT